MRGYGRMLSIHRLFTITLGSLRTATVEYGPWWLRSCAVRSVESLGAPSTKTPPKSEVTVIDRIAVYPPIPPTYGPEWKEAQVQRQLVLEKVCAISLRDATFSICFTHPISRAASLLVNHVYPFQNFKSYLCSRRNETDAVWINDQPWRALCVHHQPDMVSYWL